MALLIRLRCFLVGCLAISPSPSSRLLVRGSHDCPVKRRAHWSEPTVAAAFIGAIPGTPDVPDSRVLRRGFLRGAQCILAEGKKTALAVGVTTMSTADMWVADARPCAQAHVCDLKCALLVVVTIYGFRRVSAGVRVVVGAVPWTFRIPVRCLRRVHGNVSRADEGVVSVVACVQLLSSSPWGCALRGLCSRLHVDAHAYVWYCVASAVYCFRLIYRCPRCCSPLPVDLLRGGCCNRRRDVLLGCAEFLVIPSDPMNKQGWHE